MSIQSQQKFEQKAKLRTRAGNNKYKKYKDMLGEYGYYRLRKIYTSMKQRCYDKNCTNYLKYGARGITICEEWLKDRTIFYDWCISNGYDIDLTIDRIDNDKGYSPKNCRWVDSIVQSNNRRNIKRYEVNGEILTLTEICKKYNIKESTMWNRFYRDGCSIEEILTKENYTLACRKCKELFLGEKK